MTRTGLKIGAFYERKPLFEQSADMERLQTALIGKRPLFKGWWETHGKSWASYSLIWVMCGAILVMAVI